MNLIMHDFSKKYHISMEIINLSGHKFTEINAN